MIEITLYTSEVGSIMYDIFHNRPDLACIVSIYGQSWLSLLGCFELGD